MADENLFPEGYEDEILEEEDLEEGIIGYRPGVAFSWNPGDFVRDGRHRLLEATGVESWQQWCMNCLQTAKGKHLAYSENFGIDIDEAFAAESQDEAESILIREITDALQADPYGRTEYVENVIFNWMAKDAVQITATVVGISDVTIDVTTYISND